MSSLRDMEELISDIVDVELKEYMREALTCYMTGAHRACVVLSFIAIFEDLIKKLDGLASTNRTARDILAEVNKKREEQKVYENDLLNRLKSEKIITELDAEFLSVLRTLRNKAAHPSGHKPTAEEARYVYAETIRLFLSKPVLSTTQVADQILSKLINAYLFPSTNIQDYATVVNDGVKNLHSDGHPYLLKKLIESLDNTNEVVKDNAKRYLLGLSSKPLNQDVLEQLKKQVIEKGSSDESKRQLLMECISANATLLSGLDDIVYLRLNKMFGDTISATNTADQHTYLKHPVQIVNSILHLDDALINKFFKANVDNVLKIYKFSPVLMVFVRCKDWARNTLIINIFEVAGSSTFDEANYFAKNAGSYDENIANLMSDIECFELIIHVCDAAIWGAYGADGMMKGRFNNIPKIKEKAIKALHDSSSDCQGIIEKIRSGLPNASIFESELL